MKTKIHNFFSEGDILKIIIIFIVGICLEYTLRTPPNFLQKQPMAIPSELLADKNSTNTTFNIPFGVPIGRIGSGIR